MHLYVHTVYGPVGSPIDVIHQPRNVPYSKLVVTCKMQNRNATDELNPQCSKLALLIVLANNANLLHC